MELIPPGSVIPEMNPSPEPPTPAADLAALIDTLPEEERVVLLMHYLHGLSAAQIAARLGVPERAVASVLAAGRARLMGALGL